MSHNDSQGSNFIRGLVTGAAIGAALVWFLNSTEKGKEVKEQIKDKGEETLNNLNDFVQDLEEKGKDFKKKVADIKENLEKKVKDFRQDIVEEGKMGLERIEEIEEKSHKAAKKFFTRQGKKLS